MLLAFLLLALAPTASPGQSDSGERLGSSGGYWKQCGDQHVRGAMWYDVKAHDVPCREARGIAHAYVWQGDESPGGFSCEGFSTGYETSRVACYRLRNGRSQKVRFSFGA
jgi:hypothetical protein